MNIRSEAHICTVGTRDKGNSIYSHFFIAKTYQVTNLVPCAILRHVSTQLQLQVLCLPRWQKVVGSCDNPVLQIKAANWEAHDNSAGSPLSLYCVSFVPRPQSRLKIARTKEGLVLASYPAIPTLPLFLPASASDRTAGYEATAVQECMHK